MPLFRVATSCLALAALALPLQAHAETAAPIEVILQNDAFSPAEVKAPANTPFVLKFINKDAAAAEIEAKDLKIEKVVAGKSEIIVRVSAMKPGRYLFVNEYKEETVKGTLVVE
jgi:ribosomal protein L22